MAHSLGRCSVEEQRTIGVDLFRLSLLLVDCVGHGFGREQWTQVGKWERDVKQIMRSSGDVRALAVLAGRDFWQIEASVSEESD